jgi:hypothetical protein
MFFIGVPYAVVPREALEREPAVAPCNGQECCRYEQFIPHWMIHEVTWNVGRAAITRVRCRKCGVARTRPEWRRR